MSICREELTAVGRRATVHGNVREQSKRCEKKRKGERLEGRKERVRESRQGLQVNREQL